MAVILDAYETIKVSSYLLVCIIKCYRVDEKTGIFCRNIIQVGTLNRTCSGSYRNQVLKKKKKKDITIIIMTATLQLLKWTFSKGRVAF